MTLKNLITGAAALALAAAPAAAANPASALSVARAGATLEEGSNNQIETTAIIGVLVVVVIVGVFFAVAESDGPVSA